MQLSQYRALSGDVIQHDGFLQFQDVLDITYRTTLQHYPQYASFQTSLQPGQPKAPITFGWLEITFFFDLENDTMHFFGVVPCIFDLAKGNHMYLPPMAFGNPVGMEQPLVWSDVLALCEEYNRNLPVPASPPFVRVAGDESRASSTFYMLNYFDYKTMESQFPQPEALDQPLM